MESYNNDQIKYIDDKESQYVLTEADINKYKLNRFKGWNCKSLMYTINMDGTAIMQGVATVFIAQVYGVDLTAMQLVMVILTATLASIGTAAVPGVGLITLSLVLEQAGLPVEGVALIIGVDRLLDMIRTAVNVTGDATVSTIVAYREGQLDETIFNDPAAGNPEPA